MFNEIKKDVLVFILLLLVFLDACAGSSKSTSDSDGGSLDADITIESNSSSDESIDSTEDSAEESEESDVEGDSEPDDSDSEESKDESEDVAVADSDDDEYESEEESEEKLESDFDSDGDADEDTDTSSDLESGDDDDSATFSDDDSVTDDGGSDEAESDIATDTGTISTEENTDSGSEYTTDSAFPTDTEAASGELEVFSNWPQGTAPDEIGLKLAQLFNSHTSDGNMHYAEACTWYGAIAVAALLGEQELVDSLSTRFERYLNSFGQLMNSQGHVDDNVWGIVPLEISLHTDDERFLNLGKQLADHQRDNIQAQIRGWIDDMFMITALQVQASRAIGDPEYLNLAAQTMASNTYLGSLQKLNGLFHHGANAPIHWGRGNGWVATGMTEMMWDLGEESQHYETIGQAYENMMNGLLGFQISSGEGEGLWRQIIDMESAWPETSGSAMFTYAMVSGVKNGWLDEETYGEPARRAWIALVGYLDNNGNLTEVCEGTGQSTDPNYYLQRRRNVGDYHGQAPMLWTAAALLR